VIAADHSIISSDDRLHHSTLPAGAPLLLELRSVSSEELGCGILRTEAVAHLIEH